MEHKDYKYNLKPLFEERMRKLIPDKADWEKFSEIIHKQPANFIRVNTLKTSPVELKARLEKKWDMEQPFKNHPEILIIKSELGPGELGNSIEHLLGFYYVQELSSMLSVLALEPKKNNLVLDLCASPGSKTTQIASKLENTGLIIANDKDFGRISILSANLEKCASSNVIMTRMDGVNLSSKLKGKIQFDKILVDAPCSGEGTLRSNPKTFVMWNFNMIRYFSNTQKNLLASVIPLLKPQGTLVYSTCTHAPEENESVVSFILERFPELELVKPNLPIKTRPGITQWENKEFSTQVTKCCRIYPQDNNTEGFFVSKFVKK